jgi:hypothetical protein
MVVIDEMAYIANALFYEVLVPLLEVNRTRIIGISTPTGNRYNLFTNLIQKSRPGSGSKIVVSFKVELVCDMCKSQGRYATCRHMDHLMPPWKGSSKRDDIKMIYGEGEEDTRIKESLGVAIGEQDCIFPDNSLIAFSERPEWRNEMSTYRPKVIFMSCDPNSGGSSHTAIVSVAFISNRLVVSARTC